MKVFKIDNAASTNSWLSARSGELDTPCMVYAVTQTAGRGQRGNSWEAEPGMNLTASVLMVPEGVEPQRQFVISEAIALAVVDMLRELGVAAKVKWPNDIYVGDKKICGILIEHSILGHEITQTVAGIGVNINQKVFRSDAPNPVSVIQLTGQSHSLEEVARILSEKIIIRVSQIPDRMIHPEFMKNLWRGDGAYYPFLDKLRNERISAMIQDIAEDGFMTLLTDQGDKRQYAFKEVEFVIEL